MKFLERIPGTPRRFYQFTAIDDCTRLRVLKVYDSCNQGTAIRFIDDVLRRLPFRGLVVQTDNGAEFQSRFHWHLDALDIRHVYIDLGLRNGGRTLIGRLIGSFTNSRQGWRHRDIFTCSTRSQSERENYYNYHRPHGALDGQTPHELMAKPRAGTSPASRNLQGLF